MKILATLLLSVAGSVAIAQTTITNGGFENWGNTVPAGDTHTEPTNWYSNQSGSSTASLGGQTCFKDATLFHTGMYSVRVETISGPFSTTINGNVTTGVVNAPTLSKADGYIGTTNYSTPSDTRRMNFTGRPDSLVGWYRYTPGGAGEQGKVRAILHTADYSDPETPSTYHTNPTANKVGDVTFFTPTTTVSTWTRFSVPFTYTGTGFPAYIMINVTSSANQTTTINGSKLWLDDIEAVYASASTTCGVPTGLAASAITTTGATVSWTEPAGSIGSEYVIATTPGIPTGAGTGTTTLTHSFTGLTSGTTYYVSVRDSCSATDLSSWVTIPFTTLSPAGISNTAATVFQLSAFPNPVTNDVTVSINGTIAKSGTLQMTDISGKLISTTTVSTNRCTINMNGMPAGLYLIKYTDSERTQTIKINKQ